MPQPATHAYTGSEPRAAAPSPGKPVSGAEDPTQAVETLLASPASKLVTDPRAEVDLLRRLLADQQRMLRRSIAAAAQSDKDAAAAQSEAARFREQLQKLERELQGEKASRSRDAAGAAVQAGELRRNLDQARAAHAEASRSRRLERRIFGALSAVTAFASVALGIGLWMPRPPKVPAPPGAAGPSVSAPHEPLAGDRALGRLRQALSLLPTDTVRHVLSGRRGTGCSVAPGQNEMLLRVGKEPSQAGPLAAALAKCVEELEAPLR